MAATTLSRTTLSEALTDATQDFTVASTTNISVGDLLVVGSEAMKVQEIPVSGRVRVMRGYSGTAAHAKPISSIVYIGTPDKFSDLKNSIVGITGFPGALPDYPVPGVEVADGFGNKYVLCEATTTLYGGTTVTISKDGTFTATVLSGTDVGPVGLVCEYGTSDEYVLVQRYGFNSFAQDSIADSAGTSAQLCLACTTNGSPDVGLAVAAATSFSSVVGAGQYIIHGMFLSGAATTATTSAASATGVAYPVFLNYPFVTGYTEKTNATSA